MRTLQAGKYRAFSRMKHPLTLVQSERTLLYQKHASELADSGHAYRCFCSVERLHVLAGERDKLGLPSDYDRNCAGVPDEESDERASKGEPHVIRLRVPDTPPHYTDLVYGSVGQRRKTRNTRSQRAQPSYEDPVLIKSDGLPTYHLANVVDDHYMGITHVIRAVVSKQVGFCSVGGWTDYCRNGCLQHQNICLCIKPSIGSHRSLLTLGYYKTHRGKNLASGILH